MIGVGVGRLRKAIDTGQICRGPVRYCDDVIAEATDFFRCCSRRRARRHGREAPPFAVRQRHTHRGLAENQMLARPRLRRGRLDSERRPTARRAAARRIGRR
jgi:hypothetical protein